MTSNTIVLDAIEEHRALTRKLQEIHSSSVPLALKFLEEARGKGVIDGYKVKKSTNMHRHSEKTSIGIYSADSKFRHDNWGLTTTLARAQVARADGYILAGPKLEDDLTLEIGIANPDASRGWPTHLSFELKSRATKHNIDGHGVFNLVGDVDADFRQRFIDGMDVDKFDLSQCFDNLGTALSANQATIEKEVSEIRAVIERGSFIHVPTDALTV